MADAELPIFPLSNVVLFPRIRCPLHIFEPRYRQMAAFALRGDRQIGMVTVHPDHTDEMGGDPPLFSVGCAGVVTENQQLPDGRFNVVLLGTHRFRILREPPRPAEQLFRSAEVERLEDPFPGSEVPRVTALRARILELAAALMRRLAPGRAAELAADSFEGVDDTVFVNALSNAFPFPAAEKQGLLEAESIPQRFARLEGVLSFHLAGSLAAPPDAGRVH